MSAKATRAEKVLTRIGDKLGLTPEGKNWLIAALDPFHDNPLDVVGYPDGSTSPCVTRIQKYTGGLVLPSTLGGQNMDVLILDTPHPSLLKLATASTGATSGNIICNTVYPSSTVDSFGGLWVVSAVTGSNFDYAAIVTGLGAGTHALSPLFVDPALTIGDHRIIAKGFEVHNVTAELYKGGTCTVFESPLDTYETSTAGTVVTSGAAHSTPSNTLFNPQWPATPAAAFALVNSKQWEAKDGCYVTGRANSMDIPIENGINFFNPFYSIGAASSGSITGTSIYPQVDTVGTYSMPPVLMENFNFTGAYFTGLTPQTALTINYLIVIESHPSSQDLIYSLAKPPPCRDDVALSMYSCILREMPVGVPVSENGLGDWFADAVSTVADYVSPVLSAIPHPMTMAAGGALRAAGNVGKMYGTNPTSNIGSANLSNKAATQARNAEIRARNEAIRAKKAAKAKG